MAKQDMKQVALEIMELVYPQALTIDQIEKLAAMAGVDMDSRNCNGYWYVTLCKAGLMDGPVFVNGALGYVITEFAMGNTEFPA